MSAQLFFVSDLYASKTGHITKTRDNIAVSVATKDLALIYGQYHSTMHNMPDSYALFKIAVNADNYNKEYVDKNGKLYNSIDDLNNNRLAKDIRERIALEDKNIKDCKVLVLNPDSSVAQKIEQSHAFSKFIAENITELKNGKTLDNISIEFENNDVDLYSTFHGATIKNAYIDKDENINLRIEDFYNFNPDRTSVKGRVGEKLQKQGDLKPYYVITVLKIPKTVWQNVKI